MNLLMAKGYSSKKLSTALACASLCLAISGFVAGCGDGGSTTANKELGYKQEGTVTFDLSEKVKPELRAVKYSFLNKDGLPILVTDKLSLEQETISIENVPTEAVEVIGYFFSNDKATDFSIYNISWNTNAEPTSTVKFVRDIKDTDLEYYRVDPTYSCVDKGESTYVNLIASYLPEGSKKYEILDLTPLAKIETIGHIVMQRKVSILNNLYQGTTYGTQDFEVTSDSLVNYTTNRKSGDDKDKSGDDKDYGRDCVHVSDAVLTGLVLEDVTTGIKATTNTPEVPETAPEEATGTVTPETTKILVYNPNVDMGVNRTVIDGKTYVVRKGQFIAYGIYESPTTKNNDFQVKMRDREISWETPNDKAIDFQLGKNKATYFTRAAKNNIPFSAYTYNKKNQKVSTSINIDIKDATAVLGYEASVRNPNLLLIDGEVNFKLWGAYMIDGQMSQHTFIFDVTEVGKKVVYILDEKTPAKVTPDPISRSYKLEAGEQKVGDKGKLSFKIVDEDEHDVVTSDPYEYTVVPNP